MSHLTMTTCYHYTLTATRSLLLALCYSLSATRSPLTTLFPTTQPL